jgi:hypothetical protein
MNAENWLEIEITATDQAGQTSTRHVEYRATDPTPEKAVSEIIGHIADKAGAERVHDVNAEQ